MRSSVRYGDYAPITASPEQAKHLSMVRVLLAGDNPSARVTCSGLVTIQDPSRRLPVQRLRLSADARLFSQNRALLLDRQFLATDKLRLIPETGQALKVNGITYRGALDVSLDGSGGHLQLVNVLSVEDYLKGVVPNEVQYSWPLEALKAQAVAARTFAYARLSEQAAGAYDLEASSNSQVYRGQDSERASTNQAVDETRGVVLVYHSRFISAFYHANCGGHTADVSQVWGGNAPYLDGVECGFCDQGAHHAWTIELSLSELTSILAKHGQAGGTVTGVKVLGYGSDGRATQVEIERGGTVSTLKAAAFRMLAGPDRIRSTNFEVEALGSSVRFRGQGWGHGVGLCQEGAYGQARAGRRCEDILEFYYPGSELRRLDF